MKKVSLYWNHICILHNYEKMFLEEVKQALLPYDIELNVTYFGMGYPEHMSEYFYKKDAVFFYCPFCHPVMAAANHLRSRKANDRCKFYPCLVCGTFRWRQRQGAL